MPTDGAMQDRYVGDIGDYVKLSILRALSPGCPLGIAWWLYPDESHNKDGRHIGYLGRPDQWRHLDPDLFDALAQMVASDRRDVRALETADVLPGAIFASEVMPVGGPIADRPRWLTRVQFNPPSKKPTWCSSILTMGLNRLATATDHPQQGKVS
jgi:hypothetical protein